MRRIVHEPGWQKAALVHEHKPSILLGPRLHASSIPVSRQDAVNREMTVTLEPYMDAAICQVKNA
jgi:hypothetical protein